MKIKEFVLIHKKAIKLFLTIFNTLLVIALFSSAALLFYSVSDKAPSIFGYSLFLVKDDISNNATLVFVDKTTKVAPKDNFLYISSDKKGSRVCIANETAGDMLTFSVTDDEGNSLDMSLSISGEEYGGIVKWQNDFLGRLFDIFSTRKNMPFIYMLIGGICALIILLLILLYFFFQKKDEPEEELPDTIEDTISEEDIKTAALLDILPQNHISVVDDSLPPLVAPPLEADNQQTYPKKQIDKTNIKQSFSSVAPPPVNEPAPTWDSPFSKVDSTNISNNDDVPSIESLMEEIDLLGGDWDEDLKIYSTKDKK